MKLEPILGELEATAALLGVKVSYETLAETAFGGGLCRVKGEYRVIIEKRGTVGEKVVTLARALATVPANGVELPESARELLAKYAPPGPSKKIA